MDRDAIRYRCKSVFVGRVIAQIDRQSVIPVELVANPAHGHAFVPWDRGPDFVDEVSWTHAKLAGPFRRYDGPNDVLEFRPACGRHQAIVTRSRQPLILDQGAADGPYPHGQTGN